MSTYELPDVEEFGEEDGETMNIASRRHSIESVFLSAADAGNFEKF